MIFKTKNPIAVPLTKVAIAGSALVLATMMLSSCGSLPFFDGKTVLKPVEKVTGSVVPHGKQLKIWFVRTEDGSLELVSVNRPKFEENELKAAVDELLQGPDPKEEESGVGTEIPKGTLLLGIKQDNQKIELNLSKRFAAGGGPTSMETRISQLASTVSEIEPDKKLFVNIEGERLTATSADGLEISQPINEQL